jgi:hypothetical protein
VEESGEEVGKQKTIALQVPKPTKAIVKFKPISG